MSSLTQEDCKAIGAVFIGLPLFVLFRFIVPCLALGYVVPFWLAYCHQPNKWAWWYGLLLGLAPIHQRILVQGTTLAAVVTFIASLFLG